MVEKKIPGAGAKSSQSKSNRSQGYCLHLGEMAPLGQILAAQEVLTPHTELLFSGIQFITGRCLLWLPSCFTAQAQIHSWNNKNQVQPTSGVAVGLASLSMRLGGQGHKSELCVGSVKACSERMWPDKKELYLLVEQIYLRVSHKRPFPNMELQNTTP